MNDKQVDQGSVTERLGDRTEMPVPALRCGRGATNVASAEDHPNPAGERGRDDYRGSLADLIDETLERRSSKSDSIQAWDQDEDLLPLADAILAAGWRPPQESAPDGWYPAAMREHDRANAAELDRSAVEQRAASWWEAAKEIYRRDRAEAAEYMAAWTKHIEDLTAERDEAQAKLDQVREVIAEDVSTRARFNVDVSTSYGPRFLNRIRAIVDREPARAATPPDSETEWGCRDRHGRVHSVGVENETQARAMLSMTPVRREVGPWIEVPRG